MKASGAMTTSRNDFEEGDLVIFDYFGYPTLPSRVGVVTEVNRHELGWVRCYVVRGYPYRFIPGSTSHGEWSAVCQAGNLSPA